jgi:hypothetical protein
VTGQLRSDKKLSAKDKACSKSVACRALMTYSQAAAAGYLVDNRCPLCGIRGNTVLHRVWRCQHPSVVQAREAAVPRWLLDEFSRAVDVEHDVLGVTAFVPHPADVWPRPSAAADMEYEWKGEGRQDGDSRGADRRPLLHGSLYIDGSCTTNLFVELRRAAASVVQWAGDRQSGWRMQLPIPRPLPQTPQAAEYGALALVKQCSHPALGASVASDCANVVRDVGGKPRAALIGRRVYAGVLRDALTDAAWLGRTQVRKVPAHINPTALPPGAARDDAVGNDLADQLAKQAVAGHPAPAPALVQDLEAALKRARIIVRAIGRVIQCFPPMPRERMLRPPRAVEGARVAVGNGHRWTFASGLWRCECCLRMTTSP